MAHTPPSTHYRHTRRTAVVNPKTGTVDGKVANGATVYFDLGGQEDLVTSIMLRWFDATTSGTFTLESTNLSTAEVAFDSTAAYDWFDESATITSPSGAAAGCFMLHLGNSGVKRYRLKYAAAADSEIDIAPFGVH